LFIPDVLINSLEYTQLVQVAEAAGLLVLVRDTATSYAVRVRDNNFEHYLKHIGSNTRLKLHNKRKKLYALGVIEVRNLWPQVDEFIEILNGFHQQRWGKPCYQGRNLQQIMTFLHKIAENGGAPDLSVIYCDGKAISAVLDLHYRQRIYNIQSGYQEKFQDGISLGTLHLGLQIEKAFFADADYYDFMAGNGKHSNYKQSLATHSEDFASLMLVRSPILKFLYRINDKLRYLKNS
jgi:CelD/BcsL family acetyltransferase involved in cellulose biosynthesis